MKDAYKNLAALALSMHNAPLLQKAFVWQLKACARRAFAEIRDHPPMIAAAIRHGIAALRASGQEQRASEVAELLLANAFGDESEFNQRWERLGEDEKDYIAMLVFDNASRMHRFAAPVLQRIARWGKTDRFVRALSNDGQSHYLEIAMEGYSRQSEDDLVRAFAEARNAFHPADAVHVLTVFESDSARQALSKYLVARALYNSPPRNFLAAAPKVMESILAHPHLPTRWRAIERLALDVLEGQKRVPGRSVNPTRSDVLLAGAVALVRAFKDESALPWDVQVLYASSGIVERLCRDFGLVYPTSDGAISVQAFKELSEKCDDEGPTFIYNLLVRFDLVKVAQHLGTNWGDLNPVQRGVLLGALGAARSSNTASLDAAFDGLDQPGVVIMTRAISRALNAFAEAQPSRLPENAIAPFIEACAARCLERGVTPRLSIDTTRFAIKDVKGALVRHAMCGFGYIKKINMRMVNIAPNDPLVEKIGRALAAIPDPFELYGRPDSPEVDAFWLLKFPPDVQKALARRLPQRWLTFMLSFGYSYDNALREGALPLAKASEASLSPYEQALIQKQPPTVMMSEFDLYLSSMPVTRALFMQEHRLSSARMKFVHPEPEVREILQAMEAERGHPALAPVAQAIESLSRGHLPLAQVNAPLPKIPSPSGLKRAL